MILFVLWRLACFSPFPGILDIFIIGYFGLVFELAYKNAIIPVRTYLYWKFYRLYSFF